MQLSDHDLKQLDEDYVGKLEVDKLRGLLLKVLTDLREARDRLNQNPENSSRPPSTRAPWERPPQDEDGDDREEEPVDKDEPAEEHEEAEQQEVKEEEQPQESQEKAGKGTRKPGKPGKRKGAPGYGRKVELEVTEERIHKASECAACGCALPEDALYRANTGRYELELKNPSSGAPGLEVSHIKHIYGDSLCDCGHWTRTEPGRCPTEEGWQVELTEWHLAGPMLVAFIASLAMRQRLSRKRIQEFLNDWLHVYLSAATINQCIHEAGRAVAPVEEEILAAVRQAELAYADETGWKERLNSLWLWVFTCTTATLFVVGRRSRETLQGVLGDAFTGWLMSDGYSVYRDYKWRLRCLAHLIRKARGLEQSCDKQAHLFGKRALKVLETIMEAVYQAREGPPTDSLYKQQAIRLGKFWAFCERHWNAEHEKTRALAREFMYDWDAIWAVLDDPWLPLTNNEAERALRHWVISRRLSFGTRTPQGTRAFALLASVIETCRKRRVSPWLYIAQVVAERRKGNLAPPLPQPAF